MGAKITLTSPSEAFGVLPSRAARTEKFQVERLFFFRFIFSLIPFIQGLTTKLLFEVRKCTRHSYKILKFIKCI